MLRYISKPKADEYAEFYANYVAQVEDGDLIAFLKQQGESMYELLKGVPADKQNYAYAEGKWTIKQMIAHLCDSERIFAYRLLCILRGDWHTSYPSFDENDYAKYANRQIVWRSYDDVLEEFYAVRKANLPLYNNITGDELDYRAVVSGRTVTLKALLYIIAGHVQHHKNILQERYGI